MKRKIILLKKKLNKRLNKKSNNKYNLIIKKFKKDKSIKYKCNEDEIEEFINNNEEICYNKLIDKWVNEDYLNTKLIQKYIGRTNKYDIMFSSFNELL